MRKILYLFVGLLLLSGSSVIGQDYYIKGGMGTNSIPRPLGIAFDENGYLYAISGSRILIKTDPTGKILFLSGKEGLGNGQFSIPADIAINKQGNIFVTDNGFSYVQKFDSKGNFLLKFGDRDSTDGNKPSLQGVKVDQQGNIWVTDISNHCVRKFDPSGKLLLKFGSFGSGDGQFNYPKGIAVDAENNIWIADRRNYRIQKFDSNGRFLFKFGREGTVDGTLSAPDYIMIDKQNNIWITQQGNSIQKFDPTGKFLLRIGSYGNEDGQFRTPTGIAVDAQGVIWIADWDNSRIQKFDSGGKLLGMIGWTSVNKLRTLVHMSLDDKGNIWNYGISGMTKYDSDGNYITKFGSDLYVKNVVRDKQDVLWVVDYGYSRILKFDTTGMFLNVFIDKGITDGQVANPTDLAFDKEGNIWVVNSYTQCLQKFDRTGKFLQKFGSKGDGNGQFGSPECLTIDHLGNLWVGDYKNRNIQKFDSNGRFLLKIALRYLEKDTYSTPLDILEDQQGNIWVLDQYGIQKFDSNGELITKINSIPSPRNIQLNKNGELCCLCELGVLIFSTDSKQTLLTGRIFSDENQNCRFDDTEQSLPGIIVVAQPGNYYGFTSPAGGYQIAVNPGTYTVSQVLVQTNGKQLQPVCPANNVSPEITLKSGDIENVDFANKVTTYPFLVSSVTSDRRRRCMNGTTAISYHNTGYTTAENVKVYVKCPPHIIFKSADKPYIIDKDSNYVFSIGVLMPNQAGSIWISDSVACVASVRGLTACTKVWIMPANDYALPEESQWDNSNIILNGKCVENGKVHMVIKNIGQFMADSAEFRILFDAQLALNSKYKLESGDSLVLKIPANGKTIRLEADQRPGHPHKMQTNLTIEGCVSSVNDIISKGYVDMLPQDDAEPEVAIQCLPIVDSFDPNDKLVSPRGTTTNHYTPTSSELKYTIRFQNTGTDYAYKVVVIDTLSENLDIATLQIGAASHSYSLKMSGKGKPVLTWTFSDINLPDSTHDQKGSNGFIQFSIKPKAELPEKTQIENFADIIFDYNDPVRTNTTTNVLYDVPPVIAPENQLSKKGVIFLPPTISSFTPETAKVGEQITIIGTNYQEVSSDNLVKINGMIATVVTATETQLVVTVPTGVTIGKVSVTTLGGTAISEVEFTPSPTATEQPVWSRSIVVSPNPTDGKVTVDISKASVQIQEIEIYNHLGQRINSQIISRSTIRKEINLSDNGAGIYLIVFKTDKGNASQKVILK
ncbi:DUF7619 domain-containing protein [Xanthocytophaga agilis]|uniref:T9SS type A sorting domain-containing protein n=1 Tax=Xanthocytophaga agilis TaxID=3048010 RepID=A0AAE3UDE4_9BACT|nr:T9SS type A sorting domain-containing protein [Xanthocytophaga agilis]MDJ1501748.1 T9SS type A sorting domain-containing protein [Xanthocytophaga agilis]